VRRLLRHIRTVLCALSLLLSIGACVLWVRGRSGTDRLSVSYDRYRADRSAASDTIELTSNRLLWLAAYGGQVGPYNGNVWGYYIRADRSGGRPKMEYNHWNYETGPFTYRGDDGGEGWGPLRWGFRKRTKAQDGDDFVSIRIGLSHWLVALIFLVPPALRVYRYQKSRRARKLGLCPGCGYDLRASPERCPECGLSRPVIDSAKPIPV
jgi:hypothetical protein